MSDPIDIGVLNLKDHIDAWLFGLKQNTEREISRAIFLPILRTCHIVERTSLLLSITSLGTVALMISNLASITSILRPFHFRLALTLLFLSILFGFLSKFRAVLVHISTEVEESAHARLMKTVEQFNAERNQIDELARPHRIPYNDDLDFTRPLIEILNSSPAYLRRSIKNDIEKSFNDPLFGFKKGLSDYHAQFIYCILQAIAFISFILYVAFAIQVT